MDNEELNKHVQRAATAVAQEWPGVVESDDLAQELWVEILENPSTRRIFDGKSARDAMNLLARMGHRIAAKYRDSSARFSSEVKYSVEDIKEALSGKALSSELVDDMADGMAALRERYAPYADALQSRYIGKKMPETQSDRMRLTNAHKALTDETNRVVRQKFEAAIPSQTVTLEEYRSGKAFSTLSDGPGTRRIAFPDSQESKTIFDGEFRGMGGLDMYQHWVYSDINPDEKNPVISNWSADDRKEYE